MTESSTVARGQQADASPRDRYPRKLGWTLGLAAARTDNRKHRQ